MSSDRNEEINRLIQEIVSLRIQGDNIRHQEQIAFQELTTLIITGSPTHQAATVPVTRATLVVEQEPEEEQANLQIRSARDLRPGDRVRITNSVSSIARDRPETEEDRLCTVRRITAARRVLITTDSGINTWRYSANLSYSPRHDERASSD